MLRSKEILAILSSSKDEVRKRFKAEIKGIFGSYARGEQKKESDLDIIVKFHKGATLFDLVGLADYLEEKLKVKVDIVPDDTIREEIKKEVLKETVYI